MPTDLPPPAPPREIVHAPYTALAIGLMAGITSSLLGVGGSVFLVPGMTYLLRVRQHRASGTSLAVMLSTALLSALLYNRGAQLNSQPGLDMGVILWLALGGVAGAVLGAQLSMRVPARRLRGLFGAFVAVTGVYMLLHGFLHLPQGQPHPNAMVRVLELVGVGVLTGALSGLLGVGGGVVMVPALVLLVGYTQHQAQGTSLAVIVMVSVSGALTHSLRGNVIWSLAAWMAIGSAVGALVVTPRVYAIPQETLRAMFGIFMVLVGGIISSSRPKGETGEKPRG